MKQGSQLGLNWHRRFCLLDGTDMRLFAEKPKSADAKPKTVLPLLKVAEVTPNPTVAKYGFKVLLRGEAKKEFNFDCENAANLDAWLAAMEEQRDYVKKKALPVPPRSRSHSRGQNPPME